MARKFLVNKLNNGEAVEVVEFIHLKLSVGKEEL